MAGHGGRILWSYAVAAEVERFEVQQAGKKLTLSAQLKTADVFKLRQSPLTFEVAVRGGRWTWPIQTLTVGDKRATATLLPMQKE